jgi:hypothetical protein
MTVALLALLTMNGDAEIARREPCSRYPGKIVAIAAPHARVGDHFELSVLGDRRFTYSS